MGVVKGDLRYVCGKCGAEFNNLATLEVHSIGCNASAYRTVDDDFRDMQRVHLGLNPDKVTPPVNRGSHDLHERIAELERLVERLAVEVSNLNTQLEILQAGK